MLLQTFTTPQGGSTEVNKPFIPSGGSSILFITFVSLLSLFLFSEYGTEAYDSHIYQFFTTSWDSTIFTLTDIQS
jgi:hypothetical protein